LDVDTGWQYPILSSLGKWHRSAENRHYITDLHATILNQLGLDSRQLEVPGRKRLEIDHGTPIAEIIA